MDRQALMAADLTEEPDLEPLSTALEEAVASAWAEVLKRPKKSIGANSNFLWFGGDSLAALRACRQLAEEKRCCLISWKVCWCFYFIFFTFCCSFCLPDFSVSSVGCFRMCSCQLLKHLARCSRSSLERQV